MPDSASAETERPRAQEICSTTANPFATTTGIAPTPVLFAGSWDSPAEWPSTDTRTTDPSQATSPWTMCGVLGLRLPSPPALISLTRTAAALKEPPFSAAMPDSASAETERPRAQEICSTTANPSAMTTLIAPTPVWLAESSDSRAEWPSTDTRTTDPSQATSPWTMCGVLGPRLPSPPALISLTRTAAALRVPPSSAPALPLPLDCLSPEAQPRAPEICSTTANPFATIIGITPTPRWLAESWALPRELPRCAVNSEPSRTISPWTMCGAQEPRLPSPPAPTLPLRTAVALREPVLCAQVPG